MSSARSLGNVSLSVAIGGLAVTEIALHQGWVMGQSWGVLARAFEAATIGGLADWFAVTALFREVPIPFIRRHTNIIVKNRKRIIDGVADMVQNRWLSPSIIREHLQQFSASRYVLEYIGNDTKSENVLSLFRDFIGQVVRGIDSQEVMDFLDRAIKDQLRDLNFAEPIGSWLGKTIRRGEHHGVWDTLLAAIENAVRGPETREFARRIIVRALEEYKEGGFLRGIAIDAARLLDIVNEEEAVDSFIRKVEEVAHEARGNPGHPLRTRLDGILIEFADNLASGNPDAVSMVEKLRRAILEGSDSQEVLRRALRRLRQTIEEELDSPDSDLDRLIRRIFKERLERFRVDARTRENVDIWIRKVALELVEKRHAAIGNMVRGSLEKLSDRDLIDQIEGKVGEDLQYIRLNGAIVGGLVGAVLAIGKLLK